MLCVTQKLYQEILRCEEFWTQLGKRDFKKDGSLEEYKIGHDIHKTTDIPVAKVKELCEEHKLAYSNFKSVVQHMWKMEMYSSGEMCRSEWFWRSFHDVRDRKSSLKSFGHQSRQYSARPELFLFANPINIQESSVPFCQTS